MRAEPAVEKTERLGIYGGTFAPPHVAHVRAAKAFLEQTRLDRLLVMPACVPPHKRLEDGDDPQLRLQMAHAAFGGVDPRIAVSDYEVRQAGVSYTAHTLRHFSGEGRELFFLCGTDMFLTMDTWYKPEMVFSLSTVVCALRDDGIRTLDAVRQKADQYRNRFGACVQILQNAPLSLSSTDVRRTLRAGGSVRHLVPPAVADIIEQKGLYRDR